MSKKHMVDNTQYVWEDRMANQDETDAIVKAMESFGLKPEEYAYHLYGRQDEPYGWYLFGVAPIEEYYGRETFKGDRQPEKYIILGDCIDVLSDYNRLLTLAEVHEFAFSESDGRFEAVQTWGLFKGISVEMWHKCVDAGVEFDAQYMEWDDENEQWKIYYHIAWNDCDGRDGLAAVAIPADLPSRGAADEAFVSDLGNIAVNDHTVEYVIGRIKGKEEPKGKCPKEVFVLTIIHDGDIMPEVHTTFSGAVECAINDIKEHEVEGEEYDYAAIREAVEGNYYYKDETNDTVYDIALCRVGK